MAYKHIGRLKANKRKLVVAYRTLPGDPYSCLVVPTESLSADEHDALINAVESSSGQESYEFAEAMARTQLPDGRNMLAGFHKTGKFVKRPTTDVEMTPTTTTVVGLDELNTIIAEQKGIALEDLALKGPAGETVAPKPTTSSQEDIQALVGEPRTEALQASENGVITDEALAAKYRSDADRMFKEAKRLREEAEKLIPTKKKSAKQDSVEE